MYITAEHLHSRNSKHCIACRTACINADSDWYYFVSVYAFEIKLNCDDIMMSSFIDFGSIGYLVLLWRYIHVTVTAANIWRSYSLARVPFM